MGSSSKKKNTWLFNTFRFVKIVLFIFTLCHFRFHQKNYVMFGSDQNKTLIHLLAFGDDDNSKTTRGGTCENEEILTHTLQ
jgi:hypothetical protein